MHIWAVEFCPCIYESSPRTVSLHRTAVGAFNEMRRIREKETNLETWEALPYLGYFSSFESSGVKHRMYKGGKNQWWCRIKKVEIKE